MREKNPGLAHQNQGKSLSGTSFKRNCSVSEQYMDDTDCLPDTTPYTLWYDYNGYTAYCAKNKNGCGKWTCQCDSKLAEVIRPYGTARTALTRNT